MNILFNGGAIILGIYTRTRVIV